MSVFPWRGWCGDRPVCPGAHRLRPRRGGPPFCRTCCPCCPCWSFRRWQSAEPSPAGEEGVFPRPGGTDGKGSLAGVAGESGGQVPDPVAERVGVGVPEFLVAVAEEAGPGGDVR